MINLKGNKVIELFCSSVLFLESISSGVITSEEMNWVASNQADFSRLEKATALKLGRLLDCGFIQLGCRI